MALRTDSPSTNITLIGRLRAPDDDTAWRAFVDLYTPLVYRHCRGRGLQDADAKDVTQEVFTQVSRGMRTFVYDPSRGRFRGWLGTIVSHAIGKHFTRLRRAGQGVGGSDAGGLVAGAQNENDAAWTEEFNTQILRSALDRTRPEFETATWRAFELTWIGETTPQEAAALLERPVPWIYKARFKVLAQLKEQVLFLTADVAFFAKD